MKNLSILLYNLDSSIEDDVHGCANMAPSSSTATVRAALAQVPFIKQRYLILFLLKNYYFSIY